MKNTKELPDKIIKVKADLDLQRAVGTTLLYGIARSMLKEHGEYGYTDTRTNEKILIVAS